jgi:hypothetical protein
MFHPRNSFLLHAFFDNDRERMEAFLAAEGFSCRDGSAPAPQPIAPSLGDELVALELKKQNWRALGLSEEDVARVAKAEEQEIKARWVFRRTHREGGG